MKKKSVITILTTVLVYTTILPVPAYAALPEGAPAVDVETAIMDDIRNSAKQWASQYVEELKAIPEPKDRYRRMVELVVTGWDTVGYGTNNDMKLVATWHNEGKAGDSTHRAIFDYWAETTATSCGSQYMFFQNRPMYIPYYEENGTRTYSLIDTLREYGMLDEYLFAPIDTCELRQLGAKTPGVIHSEVFSGPQFVRTGSYRLQKVIIVYCEDGTCRDLERANITNDSYDIADYCGDSSSYYRAVGGEFIPITREEIVDLGYKGVW